MRVPKMHLRLWVRLLMRDTQACPEDQERTVWPDLEADAQGLQHLRLCLAALPARDLLDFIVCEGEAQDQFLQASG